MKRFRGGTCVSERGHNGHQSRDRIDLEDKQAPPGEHCHDEDVYDAEAGPSMAAREADVWPAAVGSGESNDGIHVGHAERRWSARKK